MFGKTLLFSVALASVASVVQAGPIVYAVDAFAQFGTIDVATGDFRRTGTYDAPGGGGLSDGPNGGLFSLAFSGDLYSVNAATGATTLIGATGLTGCAQPTDACGPSSANKLGFHAGTLYATDFVNSLYTVDPLTGHSALVGLTGLPALPFIPQTSNPDGSFNFYDESLFSVGGNLYATFGAGTFNPATFQLTPIIPAALYRINSSTGTVTFIAPTDMGLSTVTGVNGTAYAFSAATHQILTLSLLNGQTSVVSNLDPGVGLIAGAVATPEPGSVWLACCGLAGLAVVSRTRRSRR